MASMKNVSLENLVYKRCSLVFFSFGNKVSTLFFDETSKGFDIKLNKENIKIFQTWFSQDFFTKDNSQMAPGLFENKENICFAFQDIKASKPKLNLPDIAKIDNILLNSTTDEKICSKNSTIEPIGNNIRPITRTLLLNLKAFEEPYGGISNSHLENLHTHKPQFKKALKEIKEKQSPSKKFKTKVDAPPSLKDSEAPKINGEDFNDELPPPLLYLGDDDMPVLQPLELSKNKKSEISKKQPSPTEMLEMPTLIPFTVETSQSFHYIKCDQTNEKSSPLKTQKKGAKRKKRGPEVDVIDGVEIFSFMSEDELKKHSPRFVLPIPEENKFENIITPTKTKDITQIKGWRTKYFSQMPYPDSLNRSEEQIACSLFSSEGQSPANTFNEGTSMEIENKIDCSNLMSPKASSSNIVHINILQPANKRAIFSSSLLDEFLESESNLDIKFLSKVNPNVKPLKEDSPIFDLGPFCKESTKSHLSSIPLKLQEIVLEKNDCSNNFANSSSVCETKHDTTLFSTAETKKVTNAEVEIMQTNIKDKKELSPQPAFHSKMSLESDSLEDSESHKRKIISDEENITSEKVNDSKLSTFISSRAERSSTDDSSSTSGLRMVLKLKKDNNGSQDGYRITDFNLGSLKVDTPLEESCPDYGWLYQGMEKPGKIIRKTLWSKASQDKKLLKKFLEEQNALSDTPTNIWQGLPLSKFPVITHEVALKAVTALDTTKKKSSSPQRNKAKFSKDNNKSTSTIVFPSKMQNLSPSGKRVRRVPSKYLDSELSLSCTSSNPENAHLEFEQTYDQPRVDIVIEPGPTEASQIELPGPIIVSTTSYADKSPLLSKNTEEERSESTLTANSSISDTFFAQSDDEVEFLGECPVKKTFRGGEVPLIVIDSSDSETDDTRNENKDLLENCLNTFSPSIPEVKNIKSVTEILGKVHQHVILLQMSSEAADKTIQHLSDKRLELYAKYTKLVESLPPSEKKKEQMSMFNKLLSINKETFTDSSYSSPPLEELVRIKKEHEEPSWPLVDPPSGFSINNPRVTVIGGGGNERILSNSRPFVAQPQVRQALSSFPGALSQDNVALHPGMVNNPTIIRPSKPSSQERVIIQNSNAASPPTLHIPENEDAAPQNIYHVLATPEGCLPTLSKERLVIQGSQAQTKRPVGNISANIVHLQPSRISQPGSVTPTTPLRVVPNTWRTSGTLSTVTKEQPFKPTPPHVSFKIGEGQLGNLTRLTQPIVAESLLVSPTSLEVPPSSNFTSSQPRLKLPRHIIASPHNLKSATNMASRVFGTFKTTKCKLKNGKIVFLLSPNKASKESLQETLAPENVEAFEQRSKESVHFPTLEKETLQTTSELPSLPTSLEEDTSLWFSGDGEPCLVTRIASEDEDNT